MVAAASASRRKYRPAERRRWCMPREDTAGSRMTLRRPVSDSDSAGAIQRVEDLDRLRAQRPVQGLEVCVGELAGAVIELGVADLAVFGLARGLEVGDIRGLRGLRRSGGPRRA